MWCLPSFTVSYSRPRFTCVFFNTNFRSLYGNSEMHMFRSTGIAGPSVVPIHCLPTFQPTLLVSNLTSLTRRPSKFGSYCYILHESNRTILDKKIESASHDACSPWKKTRLGETLCVKGPCLHLSLEVECLKERSLFSWMWGRFFVALVHSTPTLH